METAKNSPEPPAQWVPCAVKDESTLGKVERLCLAYYRLNTWQWDELAGAKPDGFDSLPRYDTRRFKRFRPKIRTKAEYIKPAMAELEEKIRKAIERRCWRMFGSGLPEEQGHQI